MIENNGDVCGISVDLIDRIRAFAALDLRLKELEKQVAIIKAEKLEVQQDLIDEMGERGMPKTYVDVDGATVGVRINRLVTASAQGFHAEVIPELEKLGMDGYVHHTVHSGSLGAYVRRLEAEEVEGSNDKSPLSPSEINELLPEGLRGKLTITEKFDLRTF